MDVEETPPLTKAMSRLASFAVSFSDFANYPECLLSNDFGTKNGQSLKEQVLRRAPKLFCAERRAALDIWELYRLDEGFHAVRVEDNTSLTQCLSVPITQSRPDPRCRLVFIQAPHSRERLNVSLEMFLQTLTYHQIMTPFLEHILPYGRQHHRRDQYGAGFRSASRFDRLDRAVPIPELGRSGLQIEHCYTLQSPELSGDAESPWSIRPCSIYHSFDLESERAVWIIVKGNDIVKELITSRIARKEQQDLGSGNGNENDLARALDSALAIHLEICRWSAENWHAYIQYLESFLQEKTRRTLSTRVDSSYRDAPATPHPDCDDTWYPEKPLHRSFTDLFKLRTLSKAAVDWDMPETDCPPPIVEEPQVSFQDLQSTHHIEEKANDAAMILKFNADVLLRLKAEYTSLVNRKSMMLGDISAICIRRFERKLSTIHADLDMQQIRAQSLIRLIHERKTLLSDIIQYRNMQATQASASKMELLTREMHEIAQKTQVETVSMRIITVVTLFFLPGTFILTLMSTPVVTFDDENENLSDRNIGVGALQFYIVVSVPLMFLTFAAWYAVYWWERRKEKRKRAEFLARLEARSIV